MNYVDAARKPHRRPPRSGEILDGALGDIASRVDTQGAGIPVVVYNPLSWDRTGPVTVELHAPPAGQRYEARDSAGAAAALADCCATIRPRRTSHSK